jgi:hypothetical protein
MKDPLSITIKVLAVSLAFTLGSCTDHFEELNTDPNNPTDIPSINIFSRVIEHSVSRELSYVYPAGWAQQWCGAQYNGWDRYSITSYGLQWHYVSDLMDLKIIIKKANDKVEHGFGYEVHQYSSLLAAAKIMRVWIFHLLTDILGDVPYSEALQGLDPHGILKPGYDPQENIYKELMQELDEANSLLDLTYALNFGEGDLLFKGGPLKWKKFGNSLKLRILNRCAGTPWSFTYNMVDTGQTTTQFTTGPGAPAYPDADNKIAQILDNPENYPIISDNTDNVLLKYPGLPYRNPICDRLIASEDLVMSESMVNWLKARNDPRLPVYAQVTQNYLDSITTEPYVGEQNGLYQLASHFPSVSRLGKRIGYDEKAPLYVLTFEEVEFIKAEYFMRIGDETSAREAYKKAIKASLDRWEVAQGNYLLHPQVAWDNAVDEGLKYQRILEQKWAGMFGQGWQAWHEARRTGFPARIFEYELEGTFYPDLGMPIRLNYPESEELDNGINVAAARTRQNIETTNFGMFSTDGIKSQMWWHTRKNPIPTETDVPGK